MSIMTSFGNKFSGTHVVDLDREGREARRIVRHWHAVDFIIQLDSTSLQEIEKNTYNPEANPTCPLVLVDASFWQGAAKLDCVTV